METSLMGADNTPKTMCILGEDTNAAELGLLMGIIMNIMAIG